MPLLQVTVMVLTIAAQASNDSGRALHAKFASLDKIDDIFWEKEILRMK